MRPTTAARDIRVDAAAFNQPRFPETEAGPGRRAIASTPSPFCIYLSIYSSACLSCLLCFFIFFGPFLIETPILIPGPFIEPSEEATMAKSEKTKKKRLQPCSPKSPFGGVNEAEGSLDRQAHKPDVIAILSVLCSSLLSSRLALLLLLPRFPRGSQEMIRREKGLRKQRKDIMKQGEKSEGGGSSSLREAASRSPIGKRP